MTDVPSMDGGEPDRSGRAQTDREGRAAAGGRLAASLAEDGAALDALLPDWAALAESSRPASLFHHPAAWASWAGTLGRGGRNPVLALREGGRLVGVLPLMQRRAWRGPTLGVRYDYDPADGRWLAARPLRPVPVRQISPALSLPATMLGPMLLAAPGRRGAAIRAAALAIAAQSGWDLAVLPVEEGERSRWEEALEAAGLATALQRLDRPACALVDVAPMALVVARQGKKFRQNVRRLEAAAGREGVAVELWSDAAAALALLRKLAAQSWKADGRAGENAVVPFDGPQETFFRAFLLGPGAPPSITAVARLGERPIAAMTATAQGGTLTTLLTFWNGEAREASPGFLVLTALVDWAAANGIGLIDYNSNNPWLRHLCDRVTVQHNLLAFAPTPRGAALRLMRRAALGLRGVRGRLRPVADGTDPERAAQG
jgi:CelD/BcsL family acetyltransferase involved in cellulose biosynthesis